jgi:tRNA(Ile)-lysidine synthase
MIMLAMAKMSTKGELRMDLTLLKAGERVCVAVSGGADSTALLVGMVEARAELGVVLTAAHIHHGLRGDEADADEAFVRELCAGLGVPLTVFRVDTAERMAAEGEGLEEAARELRYAALGGLEVDAIATAHTLNDQAETVVMKMLRGAWTEGLGGISPVVEGKIGGATGEKQVLHSVQDDKISSKQVLRSVQDDNFKVGMRIVRPMLGVRRAEVEAFLRERGQGWREDASNRDVSLTRNRVRHALMPALRSFNPKVDEALARTAEIAREEEAFWQAEVARVLPQILLPGKPVRGGGRAVSTAVGEAGCALEIARLGALPAALRRRVVRAAARSVGSRLGAEETAKVLALAGFGGYAGVLGKIGSRLELHGGLRVERSAREIRFWRMG